MKKTLKWIGIGLIILIIIGMLIPNKTIVKIDVNNAIETVKTTLDTNEFDAQIVYLDTIRQHIKDTSLIAEINKTLTQKVKLRRKVLYRYKHRPITFRSEQFAYYKSPKRFRVFIFYVNDTNWVKIRAIGDGLMHSEGRPTVAFFYTKRNLLSQISNVNSFYDALRFGYSDGCVAEYWKQPKGDVVFKKFPKEDFN